MEEERDFSGFDKSVTDLFKLCKNILKAGEKRKFTPSERKNPFLNRLEKYEKIYLKTQPNEHTLYFEKIYEKNKKNILLGPQRDNWLVEGDIIISYGEECGVKVDAKLHLSSIYRTSVKMRDEIKEEMDGLPDVGDSVEITYPTVYLLFLYRIFWELVTSETDKKKLAVHINTLEGETGLNRNVSNNDGLNDIFEAATNMAEQVSGKKIARDKLPGKNDFSKMLGQIVNDPKTKHVLGTVMEKFKNTENIGDIMTTLVDSLSSNSNSNNNNSSNSNNNLLIGESSSSTETTETTKSNIPDVNDEFADS